MRKSAMAVCGLVFGAVLLTGPAEATAQACMFSTTGTTMSLVGDCTTTETVFVPDGMTLDGNGNTITAINPGSGPFLGAVVRNAGTSAGVVNLVVTTMNLTGCAGGGDRLRGIMLEGASGVIAHNTVMNINRGASGCQEGNAIEVRNAPFEVGNHPNTMTVVIEHNDVLTYQKTGIIVNGDVSADIRLNKVGGSATQANLAANSVQIGFGAHAVVENNHIAGNSWQGPSNYAATAVLLLDAAAGTVVRHNNLMEGNADVGIYILANGVTVDNNRVFETGPDGLHDYGIGNWGSGNTVHNNKVRGYDTPVSGDSTKTVAIPSPHSPE